MRPADSAEKETGKETMRRGLYLTERDTNLLGNLFRFGALLRSQIHALHFPECTVRRVNRRLREIGEAGLIQGVPLPLGSASGGDGVILRAGNLPFYYRLTQQAAPRIAEQLGVDIAEVRRRTRTTTIGRLAHTLAVAEVAVTLRRAATTWLTVSDLRIESEAYHVYEVRHTGGGWRREIFKPDAYAHLSCGREQACHLFFEVDLGNTSRSEWEKKLQIAARYRETSLLAKRYGKSASAATLVVLTSGLKRRDYLRRIAAAFPFCRFATLTDFHRTLPQQGAETTLFLATGSDTPRSIFDTEGTNL